MVDGSDRSGAILVFRTDAVSLCPKLRAAKAV
jgi:hypothetical protein